MPLEQVMKIFAKKFGDFLMSRPAGKEATTIILSMIKIEAEVKILELDFTGVKSVGPSWLHEVCNGVRKSFPSLKIIINDAGNTSVQESMKFVDLGNS
jgi:hypothetical protein